MQNKLILQPDYTAWGETYQPCLPLNFEMQIPKNDPVRLLRQCIGGMNLTALYRTYGRIDKKLASPRQLLAILIYSGMNHLFSSRRIETACRRDVNFLYLLEGKPAPDHATISRFRSKHLASCIKELFAQMDILLQTLGVISLEHIFIDGTKIESVANKYKFVWKKTVLKNQAKLLEKLLVFIEQAEQQPSISVRHGKDLRLRHLKKMRKQLKRLQKKQGLVFVHGSGRRKSVLQKALEKLDEFIARWKDYQKKLRIMGTRNSFAKTDHDATFMRMKEDAMKNGQLKPAYNIQCGVDAEFITWATVGPQPTDTATLIPFLEDFHAHVKERYAKVIADAGYESEENYVYLKANGQAAYIKPNNYERAKTRAWKNDIGRFENMTYLSDEDAYLCANGRKLKVTGTKTVRNKTGYTSVKTCYTAEDCNGCERKAECIRSRSKLPLEERTKSLEVAKTFHEERAASKARLTSDEGIRLRVNRSIQAEGAFANIKADMGFRRFLSRGNANVLVETMLLAMAHNFGKLHQKIQRGCGGQYLFPVDVAA